jgi:hypothetical protein
MVDAEFQLVSQKSSVFLSANAKGEFTQNSQTVTFQCGLVVEKITVEDVAVIEPSETSDVESSKVIRYRLPILRYKVANRTLCPIGATLNGRCRSDSNLFHLKFFNHSREGAYMKS